MTRTEYLAIEGLNFSAGRHILRSPGHMRAYLEEPEDELKYAVGELAHSLVLEGEDLTDRYDIQPQDIKLNTKEGKEWDRARKGYAKAKGQEPKLLIKEKDANRVPRMAESIASHDLASRILRMCPGREVIFQNKYHGIPIKGLLDAVGEDANGRLTICDFKTTQDARMTSFSKRVMDLDYDLQAVWYQKLFPDDTGFVWIVIENSAPYAVNVFTPTHEMLQSGLQKLEAVITRYKICQNKNNWSTYMFGGYSTEMQQLDPPMWRIKELQGAGLV